MTTLTLERYCYADDYTQGRLWVGDRLRLATIERGWRSGAPGGLPFVSCVRDGRYSLQKHVRGNGDVVLALSNPDLDVYYRPEDRPGNKGRYLILIHRGNRADDVSGCIAPGLDSVVHEGRPFVTNSRKAMQAIMEADPASIDIVCACGTEG